MDLLIPMEVWSHRHFDGQTRSGDWLHEGCNFDSRELVDKLVEEFAQSWEFYSFSDLLGVKIV